MYTWEAAARLTLLVQGHTLAQSMQGALQEPSKQA
jgi:hypothetical protein